MVAAFCAVGSSLRIGDTCFPQGALALRAVTQTHVVSENQLAGELFPAVVRRHCAGFPSSSLL